MYNHDELCAAAAAGENDDDDGPDMSMPPKKKKEPVKYEPVAFRPGDIVSVDSAGVL